MTLWTSEDAAQATGGKTGRWVATGLSIDTRTLKEGDLFIALKGPNSDGHDYVTAAFEKGAAAALVDHVPEGVDTTKCLLVTDTLTALADLGRSGRARSQAKIIAVTGSVGKTGTKDMLEKVFSEQVKTHASQKSYNNHWGVPLTLALMPQDTEVGIFEIGMNHAGEISPLSKMVQPDVAIITTVEAVHIENFKNGEEGVAQAKAEILDGLKKGGKAFLNQNNKWFGYLSEIAEKNNIEILAFGEGAGAAASISDANLRPGSMFFTANILGESLPVAMSVSGHHHALNSLPVLLSAKFLGLDLARAVESLKDWKQRDGRGKVEVIQINPEKPPIYLLDEHYNASPVAMRAALAAMGRLKGRRIAVLGDMAELGDDAAKYHEDLAPDLLAAGVDHLFSAGPNMKYLFDALPKEKQALHTELPADLADALSEFLAPGDIVLVKGSRGGAEKPKMQVLIETVKSLSHK